jgi:2-polyprenyl-3-methyl-5-hydroxy-6-metoxy-1,4-benzoquinol methylase
LRRLLPLPTTAELRKTYGDRSYFTGELASLHDDLTKDYSPRSPIVRLYRRHLDALAKAAPPPGRLLEIGGARGVFLDMARKRGYDVQGIEMNPYATRYANDEFGIPTVQGEFESWRPDAPFDAVAAFDVIEHVPRPDLFLERMRDALAPGGVAVIGTPNASSLLGMAAEATAWSSGGRSAYPAWRFYGRGEHLTAFDRRSLSAALTKAGLRPVSWYGYAIPVRNMRDLVGPYRLAMSVLGRLPYELAVIARRAE